MATAIMLQLVMFSEINSKLNEMETISLIASMTSTGTYNVEDISKYKKIFLIARSSNDNISTGSAYTYDYIFNISNKLMASVSDAKYGVISVVSNIQISCTALTGVYLYLYGAN